MESGAPDLRAVVGRLLGRKPPSGASDLLLTPPGKRSVMIWLLEFPAPDISADIRRVADQFRRRHAVFVHSSVDFAPMVTAGVVFEALPPLATMRANPGLMDWGSWVTDRLALLQSVWAPDRAISYGMPPETYLAQATALAQATPAACAAGSDVGPA